MKSVVVLLVMGSCLMMSATVSAQDNKLRDWPNTEAGQLFKKLQEILNADQAGELEWGKTLKALVELGPDVVPELTQLLDDTPIEDRFSLRAIPFVMRGIGDRRALPALIRNVPKCCGRDGSDMGYLCPDPEVLKFLQKVDSDPDDEDGRYYSYGRPVSEIFRTLTLWSNQSYGYPDVAFMTEPTGTLRQQQLRREMMHQVATQWADWWDAHWEEHVQDPAYKSANLAPFTEEPIHLMLDRAQPLDGETWQQGHILSPMHINTYTVFFDLDTGRLSALPKQFQDLSPEELLAREEEINAWGKQAGFDIVGTMMKVGDRSVPVVQGIALEAWEIPPAFNEDLPKSPPAIRAKVGRAVENNLLVHFDADQQKFDPEADGLFFYVTAEGTPGELRVGIEVTDTNIILGTPVPDDIDHHSVGHAKGRRFSFRELVPVTTEK